MPRILLLITDLEIGGTPTVVRELAVRLHRDSDAHVQVACLSRWGPVADEILATGVKVTALDAGGTRDLAVVKRLVHLIRRERFDVVFSFLVHANAVAAAAGLFCDDPRWIQSIQTTQPEPRWHWRVQGIVSMAAEKIVVPSPSVAAVARRRADVPPGKIVIIPNGVDANAFQFEPNRPLRTPVSIGFIGRLDPIKRVPDLLDAITAVRHPAHLHLFGEGEQRGAIERIIARDALADRVTLHGAIARPQDALRRLDLLVLPSAAEGFGLVLIEAMAAGVPVVATDAPGIRDVVQHEVNGLLVPVASPDRLAMAIDRICEDAPLRERLVLAGRQTVRARYDWNAIVEQYRSLLGASFPPCGQAVTARPGSIRR